MDTTRLMWTVEAALLIDPRNPQTMAEAMARVLVDRQFRATLTRRGIARVQNFTWGSVAEKTLALYASLG